MEGTRVGLIAAFVCCAAALQNPAAAQIREKVVYSFASEQTGLFPQSSLLNVRGTLYGTTSSGGSNAIGTVFSLDLRTGVEKVLLEFGPGLDGDDPAANVIDVKGVLYGTTVAGGTVDGGTVFSFDPTTGLASTLHSFGAIGDGKQPFAGLIAVNGALYGTTYIGGGCNSHSHYVTPCGTVFSIDPGTGKETIPYYFCRQQNCTDGAYPLGGLIDANGIFYGTTTFGGQYGYGTVFSLNRTSGAEAVLYSFCSQKACSDGTQPNAGLIEVNGTLYGTTAYGGRDSCSGEGEQGCGTVFALNPTTGAETVLHVFDLSDGQFPYAGLVAVNGMLYGTTWHGGDFGKGTVFSIDLTTGAFATVHSFGKGMDGASPVAGLIDVNGTLYGTTPSGGAYTYGTVYSLKNS